MTITPEHALYCQPQQHSGLYVYVNLRLDFLAAVACEKANMCATLNLVLSAVCARRTPSGHAWGLIPYRCF